MRQRALIVLAAALLATPAFGASYYTARPDDPALLTLAKDQFPALHADGVGDDSDVLQQAITQAADHGLVLLIPSGTYRLTKTIGIPPETRLIGFGNTRPVFLLAAHTPGYDAGAPKYMIWFTGGRRRRSSRPGAGFSDATPGTFYSGLSNIDFDIQGGNPAAVAIRAHFAQHGIIAHVDFRLGDAYAGIDEVGNEAEDLHFHGGQYGIVTTGTSPSWQYTLLDSSFDHQRIAAFKTHNTGLTLVRDSFRDLPTAIAIDPNQDERLWMKDCRLENLTGPALSIGDEGNERTQLNLQDIACRNVPTVALYQKGGTRVPSGQGDNYLIKQFSYGFQIADLGEPATMRQLYNAQNLPADSAPPPTDILPLPPMNTWASLPAFGAKGDGKTDDLPAFQAAIDHAQVIFLPHGRYRVTDTIHLKPDTILVGLNPITTQIGIDDDALHFLGDGPPKAVIEAPPGGANILQGLSVDSGANNTRAVGVLWAAGEHSMIDDVKFLGGHGTWYPNRRPTPIYNAQHSGDGNPRRKWDSEGSSLLVANGGGGTFANIWTASIFSSAGMMIDNTSTPGRIYELSSEHHVRHEIIMHHVSNWSIYAEQTEEEWGESPRCLPLEIQNCANLTFANTILFRVFAMAFPGPTGIAIADSRDLHFYGIRTYGQSPFNFDNALTDASFHRAVPFREIGLVNISGDPPAPLPPPPAAVVAPGATLQKVGDGFFSADHAVADAAGNVYFVDLHQNKIFRYSPDDHQLSVLRDDPIEPFALAIDRADDLLILSRLGKVFSLSLKNPHGPLTELAAVDAASRPGMAAVLPSDRWWDGGMFLETNARREPLQFLSPDHSLYIPVPADYHTGRQHNWTSQPIDLYRGNQLAVTQPGRPFYVADENERRTWAFTPADDGTLIHPRLFAQHGEAGVIADAAGNVYIAEGVIFVYDAAGKPIGRIRVPTHPLSLTFCGKDRRTLFIAARTAAYTIDMSVKGQ